jgi:hypothetical protein
MLNDDLISAYLDGELDAERRAMVESHLRTDRGAAARFKRMQGADALLKAAFPPKQAPQDDPLAAMILSGSGQQTQTRSRWATRVAALAAAVVLGIVFGRLVPGGQDASSLYALSAQEVRFLDTQLSGQSTQTAAGLLQMTLSVRGEDGVFCREYRVSNEAQSTDVLACRNGANGWQMAAAAVAQDADGYTPAGSASVLDGAIATLGPTEALDADQERALIERGWR